ncbi:MAG: amidohydrolase family protein [Acidobacteriota bacterium]|nr:amidohydrolase family protein [Acidobacteriota bacterium]
MLALTGATIYVDPAAEPIREGVVLIDGEMIAAVGTAIEIPAGAQTIDCTGRTITAGFWNSHVHFFQRKWAKASELAAAELQKQLDETLTRYGFTTVFDTGSSLANTRAIRDRIERGEVHGPRIFTTGEALLAPEAMPPTRILATLGIAPFSGPEITDDASAVHATRTLLEAGADAIKLHLQPPPAPHLPIGESAIRAVVETAHAAGKLVFVHPHTTADVALALRCGVDVIAHTTPMSDPWRDLEPRAALTPTLTLWPYVFRHDRHALQKQFANAAIEQLRTWISRGGRVLFGTDQGAVPDDPRAEYDAMVQAGMTFRDILASLTTTPAEVFGEVNVGKVAQGFAAGLVVLGGGGLGDVVMTIQRGRVTCRAPV